MNPFLVAEALAVSVPRWLVISVFAPALGHVSLPLAGWWGRRGHIQAEGCMKGQRLGW